MADRPGDSPIADATRAAFEAAAGARVTMVIGPSDAGKTTLTTVLAGALAARGDRVAVVDADVGQSEVGPPTTVGLGRVHRALARLGDAEVLALEFVGTTSPARAVRRTAAAAGALVERARAAGFDRILVDTSGLVGGPFGRWLKRVKMDLVRPDVVVVVERDHETDTVARDAALRPGVRVLRVRAAPQARRRRQEERRLHRRRTLAAYFTGAPVLRLGAGTVAMRRLDAAEAPAPGPDDVGRLVGLHDRAGETRGVGWLVECDAAGLSVATPVAADAIATVTIGRERYEG